MKNLIFIFYFLFISNIIFAQHDSTYYPDKSYPFHFYYYSFYKNGQLKSQGVFNPHGNTGVMDSIWTYYDSLGHVTQTEEYFVEKNILIRKEFHTNGKLKSEKKYFDNEVTESGEIPDGEWKFWDENGVLVKTEFYKNGELIKKK